MDQKLKKLINYSIKKGVAHLTLTLEELKEIQRLVNELNEVKKENQVLLVNKNVAQGVATKFKLENDKYKKVIEILKSNYFIVTSNANSETGYIMCVESDITQQEYETLLEVLKIAKNTKNTKNKVRYHF